MEIEMLEPVFMARYLHTCRLFLTLLKLPQCGIYFLDFGDFMYIYVSNRFWIFFSLILILHLTYF